MQIIHACKMQKKAYESYQTKCKKPVAHVKVEGM